MLPYDQIPRERLATGDSAGRLGEHNGVLGVALAQWMARDDSRGDAGTRQTANTAMDTIDAMLRELHQLRTRLAAEIRDSDDESMRHAGQLLEHGRQDRAQAAATAVTGTAGADARAPR